MLSECNTRQQHDSKTAKRPRRRQLLVFLASRYPCYASDCGQVLPQSASPVPRGALEIRLYLRVMGILMKKIILSVAAVLAIGVGSAAAADLAKVYKKAPPPVAA